MNNKRKEAAVKKYAATDPGELESALLADEKNYSAEEVAEIIAAIEGSDQANTEYPKEEKPKYEEWTVRAEIKDLDDQYAQVSFRKIEKLRDGIIITQETADNWNVGNAQRTSVNPKLLLLPNESLDRFTHKFRK